MSLRHCAYVPSATSVACCRLPVPRFPGCQYTTVMQLWDLRVAVGKSLITHLPSSWLGIGEVGTPLRISGNAQICAHQQHLYSSNTIAAATLFQLATAMHALKYAKCQPLAFAFTFTSCQYDRSPSSPSPSTPMGFPVPHGNPSHPIQLADQFST